MRHRLAPAVLAVVLAALPALAGAGAAPARSAPWLLHQLAAKARVLAQQAGPAHAADAKTWEAWAGLYDQLAASPDAQHTDARTFAEANARGTHQLAGDADHLGAHRAAALYRASARLWADLARQLAAGGALSISFPRAEMLRAVPGLVGTPWARQPADRVLARFVLCEGLAARVRSCKAQLDELRREQRLGANNGDAIVVEMTQCDRQQEAFVGSCAK